MGINAQVYLAPLPTVYGAVFLAFPFPFAKELDARAVHQQILLRGAAPVRQLHLQRFLAATLSAQDLDDVLIATLVEEVWGVGRKIAAQLHEGGRAHRAGLSPAGSGHCAQTLERRAGAQRARVAGDAVHRPG